jgi:anti-sigma factor RsiW
VTCEEFEGMTSAYVDRELDLVTALQVESHVAACAACHAALRRAEAVHAAIVAAPLTYPVPQGLEARIGAAVRGAPRTRSRWFGRIARAGGVPAAAAAAGALLTWVAVGFVGGSRGDLPIAQELVGAHVRSLMADHLVDVASSDRHTVRPWFGGKIDFAPVVGDYAANGFPLVGGRVDYLAGRPVAALVYRHDRHVINVFVAPAGTERHRAGAADAQGYHLLHWTADGLSYWAISDANPQELRDLAELIGETHS